MIEDPSFIELAREIASTISNDFSEYNSEFRRITQRARSRFENRDWKGSQRDAVERIELYDIAVSRTATEIKLRLGYLCNNKSLWTLTKSSFAEIIKNYHDSEFCKTFFSSITRKLFETIGVDKDVEFTAVEFAVTPRPTKPIPSKTYELGNSQQDLFREILTDFEFSAPYINIEEDIRYICNEVNAFRAHWNIQKDIQRIEIVTPVFHQLTRAYLIGKLHGDGCTLPLIISLKNTAPGVAVDAVMLTKNEASILFSFTRSYFHVDLERVGDAVGYLAPIMRRKTAGELYTVLGRAKQGKTDRYRSLLEHLKNSNDCFEHAPGDKGLVMLVFSLPSYDIVIKVIRDHFAYPKTTSRQDVLDKYQLVFEHDRAGRLIDAQEFRYLTIARNRFAPGLLDELLSETSESVRVDGEHVILDHCYIERRLTPLNLYLQQANISDAKKIVYDYGQAVRDLALSNIFPGDLLLKNFGVTRYGRVIFYDYDELCMVTDCNFRDLPPPQTLEDEMSAETWFYVGENDVFPEQFISFLGFDEELKQFFLDWHSEILTASYWRTLQTQHRLGKVIDVLPYHRYPITSE